ncbi:MAG: collagen-like protein [Thermoleophilia bacterium]|nr:collagen-like protein [Thermoleophilia bacterium]
MSVLGVRRMTLQAFLVGVLLLLGTGSAASAESPDPMSASLTAAVGPSGFGGDWAATRDWGIPPCRCEGVRGPRGWSGPRGPKGKTGARGPKGKAGARGATGAAGTAGATGPSGPAGIVGATGPIGPIGPTGIAGATGPTGQVGVTGETGATGASAQSEYAYIYNLDPEVVPIAADVTFSTNGPIGSTLVSHTPGTATITVNTSGVYEIGFSVSGVEPNQFTIFVNGIAVPGSTYGSGAGTQQNTGVTMVALLAGDAVTLRNFSSAAAVTLQTLAGGTETNVNASMTFLRLSN